MIQQGGGGRIIAISSIHAVLSEPNCGHYTIAKGGIEAFCRTLATELAPHKITVNYIRPGATYTELTTPMDTPSVKRALFERVPLKEIAQADWIAAGAVFLASDESRSMTGEWRGVTGKPRVHIDLAIGVLVLSMLILALGNSLAGAAGKWKALR